VGFYKQRQIEQGELGYSSPGSDFVCDQCVADVALKALIAEEAVADRCGFCGREEDRPIAAETDDVLDRVGRSLQREWDDPNNVLFYDSEEESGFIGAAVLDTGEVLGEERVLPFANDSFERFVLDAFIDAQWCQRDPYALDPGEALRFGWDGFRQTVKHEARFVFALISHDVDPEVEDPGEPVQRGAAMLRELARLIVSYSLVSEIPARRTLYRVRVHDAGEDLRTAAGLGSPPRDRASQSRMSPAGIPMLYCAEDVDTALAETVDPNRDAGKMATVATFRTTADCRVVDLRRLPDVPSIFDPREEGTRERAELGFLHGFRRDVSAPIKDVDRIHIEYVPTQVVSEYIRYLLRDAEGRAVDGLAYNSAQAAGDSAVLFLDGSQCLDAGDHAWARDVLCVELANVERRPL
jgi:hypothetical protein